MLAKLASTFARFARFASVGAVVGLVNYIIYLGCLAIGYHYLAAVVLSWMPSIALGYWLNRGITFGSTVAPNLSEFAGYAASALVQMGLAMIVVAGFVEILLVPPVFAPFATLAVVSIGHYLALDRLVFRRTTRAPVNSEVSG